MDYLTLLKGFDEPGDYAFPLAYDREALEEAAAATLVRLRESLRSELQLDGSPQDASFYGDLLLRPAPADDAADSPPTPRIRFSNFGWMATILERGQLSEQEDRAVLTALAESGFLFIPETELDVPYEGQLPAAWDVGTWRHRFFGYL